MSAVWLRKVGQSVLARVTPGTFSRARPTASPEFPGVSSPLVPLKRAPRDADVPLRTLQAARFANRPPRTVAVTQVTRLQAAEPQRMSVTAIRAVKSFSTANPVSAQVA